MYVCMYCLCTIACLLHIMLLLFCSILIHLRLLVNVVDFVAFSYLSYSYYGLHCTPPFMNVTFHPYITFTSQILIRVALVWLHIPVASYYVIHPSIALHEEKVCVLMWPKHVLVSDVVLAGVQWHDLTFLQGGGEGAGLLSASLDFIGRLSTSVARGCSLSVRLHSDTLSSCAAAVGFIRHAVSRPLESRDMRPAVAPFDFLPWQRLRSGSALTHIFDMHAQSPAACLVTF